MMLKTKKFSTAPITACSLKLEAVWKVGLQVRNLGVKMWKPISLN